MKKEDIRNIAIIAHVDHGKTTLVDSLLKSAGTFRENENIKDRVMDSNSIERERGITILSKNTGLNYQGVKINIVDTPGHVDFGGEVERVLKMVNGVLLLVDAFEGPMPQTKFVLSKAIDLSLPVIVCINKIDRQEARPMEVYDEVLDLFLDLGGDESYFNSPFIYTSAREGYAKENLDDESQGMGPLFQAIIKYIPAPEGNIKEPFQMLISTIDYNDYVGRIGIGKIERGSVNINDELVILNYLDPKKQNKVRATQIFEFEGLNRVEKKSSTVGNIIAISGIGDINIGDTISSIESPEALDFIKISEPTLAIDFSVNNSPFAGKEGDFVTSRQLRDRLYRETRTDVGLRVEDTEDTDRFKVSGRGELHLSVLIENMRREGYEFQVSKPIPLYREENGKTYEPIEEVVVDVDKEYIGTVIEKLGSRKGKLEKMEETAGYTRLIFTIPSRGLIGYRQEFLTDTKGNGVLNSTFKGYQLYKGEIPKRDSGSIISFDTGTSTAYGLNIAQERGHLFIGPGVEVYKGMIVGESPRGLDLEVNVTRKKQQTNIRAAGSDDSIRLSPFKNLSLEEALEFIEDDELIEITPKNFRLRKKYLDPHMRNKMKNKI